MPQAPQPSDHVLARLKAGETVYQAGELPETLRVSKIHYEPPKTVYEIPFASIFPPSMENGDGTRYLVVSHLGQLHVRSPHASSLGFLARESSEGGLPLRSTNRARGSGGQLGVGDMLIRPLQSIQQLRAGPEGRVELRPPEEDSRSDTAPMVVVQNETPGRLGDPSALSAAREALFCGGESAEPVAGSCWSVRRCRDSSLHMLAGQMWLSKFAVVGVYDSVLRTFF